MVLGLTLWRSFFLVLFMMVGSTVIDLGTSTLLLSLSGILGMWIGTRLAFTRLSNSGMFVLVVFFALAYCFLSWVFSLLPPSWLNNVFFIYLLGLHGDLIILLFLAALLSTFAFWRFKVVGTFEMLGFSLIGVLVFASHRNFHFEMPKSVSSLAWYFGVSQLSMLVVLGVIVVLTFFSYLYVISLPAVPIASHRQYSSFKHHPGRGGKFFTLSVLLLMGLAVLFLAELVYRYYYSASLTRTGNGVGQATGEKMSPLGFHSALGGNNQPAALARLEGDYPQNPFLPMLYFRESALSEFNGREIVVASRKYDQDVNLSRPDEVYRGEEKTELSFRTPLTQSVYLLSDHKNAFAIDFPISISQLKNPNPGRFRAAYRAYSMAPAFELKSLIEDKTGDPKWREEERKHYLMIHPDQRYLSLAQEITISKPSLIEKAIAVVQYLSKNAIYTLTPGHEVGPQEDPVAPFLFGDRRGYCVHFAHASVYMLRALGIPSRIGTGYLTDLSEAKDGHILLRMSDRHAWAEVFIEGKGWVPFDTQPEQVENHGESPVDMKLLEELMAMLEPGEEILPKELMTKDDPALQPESSWALPKWQSLLWPLFVMLLFTILLKIYLWWAWLIPGSPVGKLKRSYLALLSHLYDLGLRRRQGETRLEFRDRVSRSLGLDMLAMTEVVSRTVYSEGGFGKVVSNEVDGFLKSDFESWIRLRRSQRMRAVFSLSSVMAFLRGERW